MTTLVVPEKPEELAELIADSVKLQPWTAEPEKFKELIDAYAKLQVKAGLGDQLKASMKEGLDAFLKEQEEKGQVPSKRLPLSPEALKNGGTPKAYRGYAGLAELGATTKQMRQIAATGRGPGTVLDGEWEHLGQFLEVIAKLDPMTRQGAPDKLKDLSEGIGADGGFLVPEEFRAELLMLALEAAVIRPRARVIPMASASVRIPSIRDASHATSVFGGVQAAWVAEAGSLSTVRQPTFAQILLTARKLTGYTVASNELLQDAAIGLEALIMSLFSDALAYFEDDAFIAGTGAGQPLGILNADALVSVAAEAGQAANTIVLENLFSMFSRMLPQSLSRAVWIGHPNIFPQLAQLALNVGTGGSAVWLTNVAGGPPATIFGRPLILTEKAETLGTAGDLYFVDLGFYLIGDRQSL